MIRLVAPFTAELPDDGEDHVLGKHALPQFAGQGDLHGLRPAECADPFQDPHLEVGRPHAGGKGAERAVRAGVGIAHDHGVAGADEPLFREERVADAVAADVEEIRDMVAPRPVAQHLALGGGVRVLGRGHVIDDGLDPGGIEHPVLAEAHQVQDGGGGGDFVAEHGVQADDPHVLRRPVHHVGLKYFSAT